MIFDSKYIVLPTILLIVVSTWFGCDTGSVTLPPTREEALQTLEMMYEDIRLKVGADAVRTPTYRPVNIGTVYIKDLCNQSIQSKSVDVLEALDESSYRVDESNESYNAIYTFTWMREWSRSNDVTLGLKILDHSLDAIFSNEDSTAQSVNVKVSLSDVIYEEFSSPDNVLDDFVETLKENGDKVGGDILIVGIWRARVKTELDIRDKNGKQVSLGLKAKISDVANINGDVYVKESTTSQKFNILEESAEGATVFAVIVKPLDISVQDGEKIRLQRNACTGSGAPKTQQIAATDQMSGKIVATFIFEPLAKEPMGPDQWSIDVRNELSVPVSFNYDITVRDIYGQLAKKTSFGVVNIQPGEVRGLPELTDIKLPDFDKSSINVSISSVR